MSIMGEQEVGFGVTWWHNFGVYPFENSQLIRTILKKLISFC